MSNTTNTTTALALALIALLTSCGKKEEASTNSAQPKVVQVTTLDPEKDPVLYVVLEISPVGEVRVEQGLGQGSNFVKATYREVIDKKWVTKPSRIYIRAEGPLEVGDLVNLWAYSEEQLLETGEVVRITKSVRAKRAEKVKTP